MAFISPKTGRFCDSRNCTPSNPNQSRLTSSIKRQTRLNSRLLRRMLSTATESLPSQSPTRSESPEILLSSRDHYSPISFLSNAFRMWSLSRASRDSVCQNLSIAITFSIAVSQSGGMDRHNSGELRAAKRTNALRVHERRVSHIP